MQRQDKNNVETNSHKMVIESLEKPVFFSFSHTTWFGGVETEKNIKIGPMIMDSTLVNTE